MLERILAGFFHLPILVRFLTLIFGRFQTHRSHHPFVRGINLCRSC